MTVTTARPRVMITSGDVVVLQTLAATGDPRYTALKSFVDAHLPVAPDRSNAYPPYGDDYAMVYQITGDPKYAQAAVAATSGSLNVSDIATDSFLATKTVMPQIAAVYDWCNDWIVAHGLQATYVTGMTNQANAVWPETDPTRSTGWAVNSPDNNYYYGLLNTWQYGIALYYDTAAASGWLNNALSKFNSVVRPFLTSANYTYSCSGGYFQEGTSYGAGSVEYLFKNLYGHMVATGDNLFTSGGFTWPKEALLTQLYVTAPNRAENYPGGAQAGAANLLRTAHKTLIQTPQRYLDATTAGYAKQYLNTVTFGEDGIHQSLREDFMFYRPEIDPVDYTAALPLDYTAAGAGLVTCRSDWSTGATQLWFISGPQNSLGNHQTDAANGFQIWRNYWLAASTQINHSTDAALASDNNSVTVGGNEQYYGSDTSALTHHVATSGYAYYSGEAGPAYQKQDFTPWLNGFRRDILYVKPNLFVICDRLDAPDATLVKKFHVNGLQTTPPPISANTYTISGYVPDSKLFGTALLPAAAAITTTNTYSTVYRVDVAAPTGNTVDYGLNVLEAAPGSQSTATPVTNLTTNKVGVQGVQFTSGSVTHVPVFEMRPGPASNFTFTITGTGTHNFYVATNHPGTVYNWAMTPTSGAASATGAVTADAQGLLTWNLSTTGNVTVAMTTAQAPPPFSVYQPAGSLVSAAAATTSVHLSGATFGATSGTVTFGTSGATVTSWTTGDIVATVPAQASYPHTDDLTVSWMTSVTASSGAHFTAANSPFLKATNPAALTPAASQSFSFAGWVYLDSKTAEQAFFSKFNTTGNQRAYALTYDQTANRFRFYVSTGGDGSSLVNIQDAHLGSPATATWIFVACGWNAATKKAFLSINDGGLDQTAAQASDTIFASTADFYAGGGYNAASTSWVDGRLDNWGAWFGKALSAAEITSLYNAAAGVNYADLAGTSLSGATAFWQFDDAGGAGAVWTDKVGTVPLTGGTSTAAPTTIGGHVAFTQSTTTTDTYPSFVTTAPAGAAGPSITAIKQGVSTVTAAAALSLVKIVGSGFGTPAGTVFFGSQPASIASWTDTVITAIVPAQTSYPKTVGVQVTAAAGGSDTKSGFTVTVFDCSNCPTFLFWG